MKVEPIGVKFKEQTYILVKSPVKEQVTILTTRLPYARDGLRVERRVPSQ